MANTEQQKILSINVDVTKAIEGIAKYKEMLDTIKVEQAKLNGQWNAGTISVEEYHKKMEQLNAESQYYKRNIQVLAKEQQNQLRIENEQKGSLVALRAELSNVTKAYDSLSREERENGEQGEKYRKQINAITGEIKKAEEETQRYYRNVGNYENAIQDALGANSKWYRGLQQIADVTKGGLTNAFRLATDSVKAFAKQLWALMVSNPIITAIAAIAAAIVGLTKVMFSNEEQTNRIRVLLAPVERGLTALLNVLQKVAGWLLDVAEQTANFVGWLFKLAEALPLVGGGIKKINDTMREGINLEKEEQQLVKDRRKNTEQDAKDRQRLAELDKQAARQRVTDTKGYIATMKERQEIVEKQAKRHEDIAKRELALAEARAKQSKNNAETEDDLAQKRAAVADAQSEATRNTIKDARGLAMAENKLAKDATAAAKSVKDLQQQIKETADAEREAIRSAEDALTALIENNVQRQTTAINTNYNRRIEDLERQKAELKEKGTLSAATEKAINDNIVAQRKLRDKELQELADATAKETLEREERRLALLLEATENNLLKQREFQLSQLDVQEQLDREEIEKSVQNEQERENLLLALQAAYNAKRLQIEQDFDNQLTESMLQAIEDDYARRIEDARGNELEQMRLDAEMKLELLNNAQQLEGESIEAFNARKLQLEKDYYDARDDLDAKEFEIKKANAEAIADLMGSLSDALGTLGEKNKAFAKLSKVLALGEIAVNTGVALAEGIKQAQSVPFPANIAAIATTVATILANIATAIKTVNSAKFAKGGTITGAGTGTSDSITARVSNGESIMTAQATAMFSPLLSTLNQLGGGVPIVVNSPQNQLGEDFLAAAVAKGMTYAPQPVVSVEEINRVGNRVQVIENIASV